jgi:hypothetical protein
MFSLSVKGSEMRLRFCVAGLLLAISPPIGGGVLAETLGNARVGFSAERVLVIDGKSYIGKMWHMPGAQRHEQALPTLKPIFILRADSPVAEAILAKLHTVVEFAVPEELSLLGDPKLLRDPVGRETVNGIATTKYAIDAETPASHAVGTLWLSEDAIPMQCDARVEGRNGKASTIHWELRHVEIGTQDATLFDVPRHYARLSPEAAAPLLGMHLARPRAH